MTSQCWLAVAASLVCWVVAAGNLCTSAELNRCLRVRNQFLLDEGYNHTNIALYMLEESHLRQYCQIYKYQVYGCLENMARDCGEVSQAWINGIIDSTRFLCEEKFDEYLSLLKQCLKEPDVKARLMTCRDQFERKKAFTDSLPDSTSTDHCSTYSEFIDCEADEVAIGCGEKAGEWAREYDTHVYKHYMDVLGCNDQPTTPEQEETGLALWLIIVIAVGGALVFVGLFVCLVRCMCRGKKDGRSGRRRKRRASRRDPEINGNGAVYPMPAESYMWNGVAWVHVQQPYTPAPSMTSGPSVTSKPQNPPSHKVNDSQDYVQPTQSVRTEESVRYHMGPTHKQTPPAYTGVEYAPGSPPPSYTSQETEYTKLQEKEYTKLQAPANQQPPAKPSVYEELPDAPALPKNRPKTKKKGKKK